MTIQSFSTGDAVRIAPHTDLFARGFSSGTVSSVNRRRNRVYVRWDFNRRIRRPFHPTHLEHARRT